MSNNEQTMQHYQQHVLEEEADIESKLGKLMLFIKSEQFSCLTVEQQDLLNMQYYAMEIYSHALSLRIKAFNVP